MEIPSKHTVNMSRPPSLRRRSVRKAHRGLGHPPLNKFLRILRLGGGKTLAVSCVSGGKPPKPTTEGNDMVATKRYSTWHAWQRIVRPRTWSRVFIEMWLTHRGVPKVVVVDQGLLWSVKNLGSTSASLGATRNGKQGLVERHGGCLDKVVDAPHTWGSQQAKMALAMCVQAKDATLTRFGVTREQSVWTSTEMVCNPQSMRKIHIDFPLLHVFVQAGVAGSDGGKHCIARARRKSCFQEQRVHFYLPHPYNGRHEEMART